MERVWSLSRIANQKLRHSADSALAIIIQADFRGFTRVRARRSETACSAGDADGESARGTENRDVRSSRRDARRSLGRALICTCVCAYDGPYDNEGVISKLLCRKLLSCVRERRTGANGWTEASRYGNVIWGLCLLVYYGRNNAHGDITVVQSRT